MPDLNPHQQWKGGYPHQALSEAVPGATIMTAEWLTPWHVS